MNKWWKNPNFLGGLLYWLIGAFKLTLRIKVQIDPSLNVKEPYLFAFWHGKQLLPALSIAQYQKTPLVVMTSPSNDGAILAKFLSKVGYDIIRGSSRDGNIRALLQMKKRLDNGASVGFAIDGPIGPIYVAKPGIVYLAQKCNVKIIPVGSAFSRYWVFDKAWDKFQLPKPFAKAALVLGEPFSISVDQDIESGCRLIAEKIKAAEVQAQKFL